MKKILPVLVVGILLISGIGTVALHEEKTGKTTRITVAFLPPIIEESGEYVEACLENASYLMDAGKPMLPKVVKTIELEFGVRNVKVEVKPKNVQEYEISNEISPAPAPVLLIAGNEIVESEKNEEIYASKEIFPSRWYRYRVGCGLNDANERVTHVAIHLFPIRYAPAQNKLYVAESANVGITYEKPETNPFPENAAYDLVIIAPSEFSTGLQRLVEHKNEYGVNTILKTTEEIYDEYTGVDKPEQIKYFIKDAIENWNIRYVMLVGGLKSQFWAKARDNANMGARDWHLPVRYTNLYDNPAFPLEAESIHDPGTICDLYYADVYKEGGEFEDWDPNNDGIFAAWNKPGVANDTYLDLYPDVAVGRLACRSVSEVQTVVDKIITYEQGCDPSWFKRMTVISGDGFLDQEDLNIRWDTSGLPNGKYTIYAQSNNPEGDYGPLDVINVTLDKSAETELSFNHDDHLKAALQNGYPAPPIAEIVSVSEGDILGKTDYHYSPGENEAYLNFFYHWANISYEDGVLIIRGKSYDPQPYGNVTDIHVWVKNSDDEVVFEDWRNNTEMYYEGEWAVGDHVLKGRGGALYYMPEDFEENVVFASNGRFTGQEDVISAFNEGSGFLFMSGHGSPNVWADHYPGIPGNRAGGSITGLMVTQLRPWFPFIGFPVFPIDSLSNGEKLPITVIGGCHNSQFNVSVVPAMLNGLQYFFPFFGNNYMWTYGVPVPECFSWRLVRNPDGGAIASFGNTGLGYGVPGRDCLTGGGDAWITLEIFRQYGAKGEHILGDAYHQTQTHYVNTFDMTNLPAGHTKTVQEWAFLGDPSLKIGGYY